MSDHSWTDSCSSPYCFYHPNCKKCGKKEYWGCKCKEEKQETVKDEKQDKK